MLQSIEADSVTGCFAQSKEKSRGQLISDARLDIVL